MVRERRRLLISPERLREAPVAADGLPQLPLTAEESAFIAKPEYERRPGREINKHLPHLWPAVPSAGTWGGTS